jgi:hypothetical protein
MEISGGARSDPASSTPRSMHLDPILILRHSSATKDVIVLQTFDEVKAYLGANGASAKTGVVNSLAKAGSPSQRKLAVREFERWARLTELLVTSIPADQFDSTQWLQDGQ